MTAIETFRLLVSLAAVSDGELFEHVAAQLPQEIPESHIRAFRGIAIKLQQLINEYEYVDSPAYLNAIQGKSIQVAMMMRKQCSDPVRRNECRRKFVEALGQLPENRAAFSLIAERHHGVIAEALEAFAIARNVTTG